MCHWRLLAPCHMSSMKMLLCWSEEKSFRANEFGYLQSFNMEWSEKRGDEERKVSHYILLATNSERAEHPRRQILTFRHFLILQRSNELFLLSEEIFQFSFSLCWRRYTMIVDREVHLTNAEEKGKRLCLEFKVTHDIEFKFSFFSIFCQIVNDTARIS